MKKRMRIRRFITALIAAMWLLSSVVSGLAEQIPGEEMLRNGDFSDPLQWQLYTESGGSAVLSIEDGEMKVDVSAIGRVGHAIQPYYDGFSLIEGVAYTLSYDVRSSLPRDLYVRIQLNGGDYHAYFEERVEVTEQTQHREATFTMGEATDPSPRLCVNMGYVDTMEAVNMDPETLNSHQVYFDNFSLKVSDTNGAVAMEEDPDAIGIRVNQVGYLPDATKLAVLAEVDADVFTVINAETGDAVLAGDCSTSVENLYAGESDRMADFTALSEPGTYYIECAGGIHSAVFTVGNNVYDTLLRDALKMLYLQRCGTALDEALAGDYAHPACHTELATIYGTQQKIDVAGGWHDAGDYGRYVVSGAKAAADLLLASECLSNMVDDTGIPESGDGLNDLLQEAKYELDWLLKMQAPSGGVYHKVSCKNFPAFVAPHEETDELIVCPISNTATGDFAAVMAMAGRIFGATDVPQWREASEVYLQAAEQAWAYLSDHAGEPGFQNPADVVTGEYPDDNDTDERFWAAAELARATGEIAYLEAAEALLEDGIRTGLGWVDVGSYGLLAMTAEEKNEVAEKLLYAVAEEAMARINANPYGVDREETYEWGSNMGVANTGVLLALTADRLNEDSMRTTALQPLDYLLGRNATGYCFVTGTGTKCPEHPHHRPSTVAGSAMPGMLVGGPDSGLEDPYAQNVLAGAAPAKCYADSDQTYSTNEVCVYWNSPLVLLLAAVMK